MSETRTSDVSKDSARPPRTIVLCFDGTNGQYDSQNTNVVKLFGLLRKDCSEQQVAYYQAGIGTYFAPGVVSPLWSRLASLLDEACAWYLDVHVMDGYKFLMANYHPGDKVCLFGFSRGAYTARALAGMLHKVGLLPKDNLQQVNFAYKAYTRTDKAGVKLAAGFKQTFSRDVKVEFIGVWDTVQSTGVLISRILPFTDDNTAVNVFRHALSLDEHRARFRPNLYHWPTQDLKPLEESSATRGVHTLTSALKGLFKRKDPNIEQQQTVDSESGPFADGAGQNECNEVASEMQLQTDLFVAEESIMCTDVLEVWFAGCHSDIGGGNVDDDVKVSLAQIPLRWMVEQAMQSQCGILFDSDGLARIGLTALSPSPETLPGSNGNGVPLATYNVETTPDTIDTSGSAAQELQNEPNRPTPSLEAEPEHSDAIAPLFDELKINKAWWILEFLPCSYAWQDDSGKWHSLWSINWGRGRFVPFQKPKFHHTVKERMEYKPFNYKPRATYDPHQVYV
ncbi:hypothetical protein OG21DRAFT_1603016 [Imleria badia]|nr:hypothetical protein OG21DRAFT_1603016 [Imleria badia]